MNSGVRLRTKRLLLRPYQVDDLDDLLAMRGRADVVRYLDLEVADRAEVADVLRRRMALDRLVAPGDALVLAAERDGRVVGDVSLEWASGEHRQAEIGFVFHPDVQGHGYATEAAGAVLDLAFGRVLVHRVSGRCDARNTRSAALMRRLGMRQEAHFVHNEWFTGGWGDELVFAVLEHEWRARSSPGVVAHSQAQRRGQIAPHPDVDGA